MEATNNIITIDSEFINAISHLDDLRRKFEDVSPIWKSGKPRSEMTDKEIKILSEYENMMDCETIGIKVGDKVAYRLDGDNKIYSGTVIDILDRGDIRTDTDGVLCAGQYAKINTTPTETPKISTQTAKTVNVSAEGENAAERAEMPQIFNCEWQTVEHFKAIPNIAKLAKAGIIINGVGWHTEYLDQAHNVLARVDNLGWDMKMHTFPYQGSGVFGKTELFENWEDAVIATIDALTDYLKTQLQTEPREAKYRVSRLSGYKIIVGDREQGKVIAVLMTVNGHNVIEIDDESANIATMGEKPLQIDKPIMQLSDAEVLELIYGSIQPPQSPETPQTADCTAKPRKLAQTA